MLPNLLSKVMTSTLSTNQDYLSSASPRLEVPENYNDGLIFRYDEVIRLKIPLIAKPSPRITWYLV